MSRHVYQWASVCLMLLTLGCSSQEEKAYEQLIRESIQVQNEVADQLATMSSEDSNQSTIQKYMQHTDRMRKMLAKMQAFTSLPESTKSEIAERYQEELDAANARYMAGVARFNEIAKSRLEAVTKRFEEIGDQEDPAAPADTK